MKYNFDEIVDRRGTSATKLEALPKGAPADALSLWVADMDFACAEPIIKALHERVDKRIFGYTLYETAETKGTIVNWYKKRYNWDEKPENIVFSPGIVSGYVYLLMLITDRAVDNGRKAVDNPLIYENGTYRMDYEDLDRKMADPANRVLVLCSPHNPAGRVWTADELRKVVDICKKYDKWIICDEIHCDLLRKGVTFTPILNVAPDYAEKIAVCTAPSKTFNLAGMKTSNIVIRDPEMRQKWLTLTGKILNVNAPSTLGLTAMCAAYNEGEEWLEQVNEYIDGNFAFIDGFLKQYLPKAHMIPSEGTYLAWIDFNGYVHGDAEKLEKIMQQKAKVALDEGYIFGEAGRGFERINIAAPRSVIEDCMNRIRGAIEENL